MELLKFSRTISPIAISVCRKQTIGELSKRYLPEAEWFATDCDASLS
jgi:hypothetical protein